VFGRGRYPYLQLLEPRISKQLQGTVFNLSHVNAGITKKKLYIHLRFKIVG
jgi:hypothetical protein